jgi:hypothetical protein
MSMIPTWRRAVPRLSVAALAIALGTTVVGCPHKDETLILIGGEPVDAATIDRDPLALLPSGAIMLGYLDAASLFGSKLGPDAGRLLQTLLPLGPEANFVPARDVSRGYGGVYAMQGADFCAVLQGNFDTASIQRAAESRTVTASGAPLIKTRYANSDLFTAGNIGFVLLTSHTVLTGNETGMRRALDRLRDGKLERSVPSWMIDLLGTQGAAFAVAGDLSSQPAVDAATSRVPFAAGLRLVRVIGNFKAPGLNFAGALTYADAQSAATGASTLGNLQQVAQFMSWLSSWGFGASIPPMQVAQNGSDVAFTLPLDDSAVRLLMGVATDAITKATKGGSTTASPWSWLGAR